MHMGTFRTLIALSLLLLLLPAAGRASECVVLLHGLAQVTDALAELESRLQRSGYVVARIDYPSTRLPPHDLAELAVGNGVSYCRARSQQVIHFVSHSLGGILVRIYLEEHTLDEQGRVVMLAPPNQGTPLVDSLSAVPGFGLLGPAGRALGTGEESIIHGLGPVNFELGVIAGTRNLNPLWWLLADGPGDGVVPVKNTWVEGLSTHLVLPVTHQTMMRNNRVIDHTIHYLKTGEFIPE
jgi:hypothetical protein